MKGLFCKSQKTVLINNTWVLNLNSLICFYHAFHLPFSLSNNSVWHNYSEKLKGCYKKEYQVTSQKESLRLLNSKQHHLMMLIHYGTVCFVNRRKNLALSVSWHRILHWIIIIKKFGHISWLSDLFVISFIVLLFFLQIFITNVNIMVSGFIAFLKCLSCFFNFLSVSILL